MDVIVCEFFNPLTVWGRIVSKERYILIVQNEGTDSPSIAIRLRKFLKCALRSFGIRCVSIRPERPPDPDAFKPPPPGSMPVAVPPRPPVPRPPPPPGSMPVSFGEDR